MNSKKSSIAIVWFRNDLRLTDNFALHEALVTYGTIIPVYVLTPEEEARWPRGGASQWWLHHSLASLDASLRTLGSRLILRSGTALQELTSIVESTGANAVYWNRRYEPASIARDTVIKKALSESGIDVKSFNSALLFEPWQIATQAKKPHQVFTPFWKTCLSISPSFMIQSAPKHLRGPSTWPQSESLESFTLLPRISWDAGFAKCWQPGEAGAHIRLQTFLKSAVMRYAISRNIPDLPGTSRLSPHLHFGEIGPRQIWNALEQLDPKGLHADVNTFRSEIGWREFAHHILYHFPTTPEEPLRANFRYFPWRTDATHLQAWQRGQTGYPIVDAGMRELWVTGWMHNRVRMIVGSFLTKHLRLSWTEGARWFWDTLVDADLASNTFGWQWVAGCGADAGPYFRIFNPMMQAEKFDPDGSYIRRWVPELSRLPKQFLHQPWEASEAELQAAGVVLGKTYPKPIVNHAQARAAALEAFAETKKVLSE